MKFSILTIFPDLIAHFVQTSLIARWVASGLIDIEIIDIRKFATNKRGDIDDYQYGGGDGMVLTPEPWVKAIETVKCENSKVVMLTPKGNLLNQKWCASNSKSDRHLIMLCGRYEGFDERIAAWADEAISIGDYVLNGGEVPAMVVMEAVSRLLPGAIKEGSAQNESFTNGLLDYPVYTKPVDFRGMMVPEILMSGNHAKIATWRQQQQLELTKKLRPDLYRIYIRKNKKEEQ